MHTIGSIIATLLILYEWVLLARVVLSFIESFNPRWSPRGAGLVVCEAIYTLTDPPVKLLRRFIRPLRIGHVALDLAVLVLFLILVVLMRVNTLIFW